MRLRGPGWARNEPVPSDLYGHLDAAAEAPSPRVNGVPADLEHRPPGHAAQSRDRQPVQPLPCGGK